MMNLDELFQPLALKHKGFFILDFSFPASLIPGFSHTQEHRFLHCPMRADSAVLLAEGFALAGWTVFVLGIHGDFQPRDLTLPIRWVHFSREGDRAALEASLAQFGFCDVLLPWADFDKL